MKNIGEAFTFPFRDPNWATKLLIGTVFAAFSVLLIGIPVVSGYCIELMQRVRRHEKYPLPEWKDVGVKFIVGLKYNVTMVIYYIPVFILIIPLILLCVLSGIHGPYAAEVFCRTVALPIILIVVIPYSLLIAILTPVISAKFAERERIGDALRVNEVFRGFRNHWQDVVVAAAICFGVRMFAWVGIILLLVGILLTVFYSYLVSFHLYGQVAETMAHSSTPAKLEVR